MMNSKLILCLALILGCALTNCFGTADTIQVQFEQMARTSSHFSLTVVIHNQALRLPDVRIAIKRWQKSHYHIHMTEIHHKSCRPPKTSKSENCVA